MTQIAISRIHFPVRSLGPGHRIGVWLQGCSIRCAGCISLDTWKPGLGLTTTDAVLTRLSAWSEEADGLTVSGGEPLDQPDALATLLQGWRSLSGGSVFLFTGRSWPEAQDWITAHPELVDAVMAGPYVPAAGDSLALRGSDNQSLHIVSGKGEPFRGFDRARTTKDRQLDVMFDDDGAIWFAGIPSGGDFERLRLLLASQGHTIVTSEDARQASHG